MMHETFANTLRDSNLTLTRSETTTLQVNVGSLCNLKCRHCHVNGGPNRKEVMTNSTMDDVIAFAKRNQFLLADITGGAPEMVPDLTYLLEGLGPLVTQMIFRSNLTLLLQKGYGHILNCLRKNKIGIVASFPSTNMNQTDSQRGNGTWQKSIECLQQLNALGYGMAENDLELILVSNPTGAFMPPDQCRAEKKFRTDLARKWDIHFSQLYTFANIPLGRFKTWLEKTENYQTYMAKLAGNFNGATIENLMCRSLISISWDGYLYDCDFNQAAGLPLDGKPTHVTEIEKIMVNTPIATDDHCYGCTAGAGFT